MSALFPTNLQTLLSAAQAQIVASGLYNDGTCFLSLNPKAQPLFPASTSYVVITPGNQYLKRQMFYVKDPQGLLFMMSGDLYVTLWSQLALDEVPRDDIYLTGSVGLLAAAQNLVNVLNNYLPLDPTTNERLLLQGWLFREMSSMTRDFNGVGFGGVSLRFAQEWLWGTAELETKSFTTDSYLISTTRETVSNTVDSLLASLDEVSTTVDSLLANIVTTSFTVDSTLYSLNTISNTVDSYLNVPGGTMTYSTNGTYTWTAPAGVTSIVVQVWGAGGGGGGGTPFAGGGGGGGGGYAEADTYSVVPGNPYAVAVGSGGTAGSSFGGNAGNGGATTFDGTISGGVGIGGGGATMSPGSPGSGGTGSGGDFAYTGGAGANDGGGSSAGTTGNGNNASGNTGGAAPTGGGAGGNGGGSPGAGSAPGGAGAGGGSSAAGAAGADGQIIVTWT